MTPANLRTELRSTMKPLYSGLIGTILIVEVPYYGGQIIQQSIIMGPEECP